MKKIKKTHRLLAFLLCFALFLAVPVASSAAVVESDDSIAQPCYDYTAFYGSTISISNGVASCNASCTGINGVTTKVSIKMILQKKGFLSYSNVETWTSTINTYHNTNAKTRSVESGTYRLKVIYTVYSGDNFETITEYSNSASC